MDSSKNNFIFFIAAMVGGGILARKLIKNAPKIMEKMMGEGCSPMDMCKQMFESFGKTKELTVSVTPEVQKLFEDWVKSMEKSVLEYIKEMGSASPQEIADYLNISLESAVFLINKLASQGKLKIGSIEAIE